MGRWTVRTGLERAVEVVREAGIRSLGFKVLGETIYRRAVLFERPLCEPIAPVKAGLPVTIGLLKPSEVEEYCRFRPYAHPSEVRRRLEAGQWCFAARHQGRLVHIAWAAGERAWIDYLKREIRLAPDEVYIYESFTATAFRDQSLAPAWEPWMLRFLKDRGYRRVVVVIGPEHSPAFRPVETAGYRRLGVMGYVRVGPWRYDFCRTRRGSLPPGVAAVERGSAYWNHVAEKASNHAYLDPFLAELKRQAHLGLIERWGGVPADGRVLKTDLFEEATGPDDLLGDLTSGAGMVVGMDVSPAIAGRAHRRDARQQARYLAADARRLPFASSTLALIVSTSTLDHFLDPSDLGRSLRELRRVLEPAGRLVVTLDNRQNIFDPLLRLAARHKRFPYYIGCSYTVEQLRAELEEADLAVQETTAILHNPRLVAVGAVSVAKKLGWASLTALVQRLLRGAQRLEKTRWRYLTGSFVAAVAVRRMTGFDGGR